MKTQALASRLMIVLFIAGSGLGCGERRASHYADLRAAEQDGAIERGWVPEHIPQSASEIHEVHYVDKTESWGAFKMSAAAAKSFGQDLAPMGAQDIGELHVRTPGETWWPEALTGALDAEGVGVAGLRLFKSDAAGTPVYFAVRNDDMAFFWRP